VDIPEQRIITMIDRESYRRVINNLVQNMITHSYATEIFLAVKKQSNVLFIQLKDNGVGIASEDLPHIFENLYTSDKSRSNKGSGLWITIVHQIIHKMNINFSIEIELKKRATI